MEHQKLPKILNLAIAFARSHEEVVALGLCGSWARGTAGPNSDIDLSIIVKDKQRFKSSDWIHEMDFESINESLDYFKDEVYGQVWSRHVFLNGHTEVEFGFADMSWADIDNLDSGTRKVVMDGFKVLYDPERILKKLVDEVKKSDST